MLGHAELLRKIKQTIPLGVEIYRPYHYTIPLKGGRFDLLVLKVFVPPEKEAAVRQWENDFEKRFGVSLVLHRGASYSGMKEALRGVANGARLLTPVHEGALKGLVQTIVGAEPKDSEAPRRAHRAAAELLNETSTPYLAIDPASVRDREDLIHAERIGPSGDIRVRTAFIDVTAFVDPHSKFDTYARRLGRSVYGTRSQVPTLGKEAAFSLGSFTEGEERAAIVVEQVIDRLGRRKSGRVYRARVKNHQSVAPSELESCSLKGCSRVIGALREATGRLRARRCESKEIFRVDRDDPGADIVGECMIAAKTELAHFLVASKTPAAFRVHTPPTPERTEALAKSVRVLGIEVKASDFEQPLRLASILKLLEDHGAHSLLQEIVDVFLVRTRFDTINRGHYGIGTPAYLEIKPRESMGLQNQFQIRSALSRGSYVGLSASEIDKRVKERNQLRESEESIEFKFRFYERLREGLSHAGQVFSGVIQEVHRGEVLVEFPEFSRWGMVQVPGHIARRVREGDMVQARLLGFNVERMRFEFEPYRRAPR
jgi:exoribonuclease R